jgi:YidC/Oxa1 family membrane protein insertase
LGQFFNSIGEFFHSLFDPIVKAMGWMLTEIHHYVPSYGLSLVLLALFVRILVFPFAQAQFKSMAEMQKLQPLVKRIQTMFKGDPQKAQMETLALYREHKVNPLAGCLPMLLPFPILISLYYVIRDRADAFKTEHFLWIGSPLSNAFPHFFAPSLAQLDFLLLALYVVSMYLSVRYGSPPSTDPQQAQTQKIMAIMSPAMIAYCGWKYEWSSALILYWLSGNVLTMAQQAVLYRRHGLIGPAADAARAAAIELANQPYKPTKNVTAKSNGKQQDNKALTGAKKGNGSPNGRAYKRGKKR